MCKGLAPRLHMTLTKCLKISPVIYNFISLRYFYVLHVCTTGTGGLSIGGKIGVGVGVVGGAFVLAVTTVLGICLCCKKKHGYEPLPGSSSSLQGKLAPHIF